MNVLLINDTRIEKNPGCHATVSALIDFIKENIEDVDVDTLMLGQEYNVFNNGNLHKRNFLSKILFKLFKINIKQFNYNFWEFLALNKLSEKTRNAITGSDLVVINMEGTIHSNSTAAFTLMAMAFYTNSIGKKVAMLNGSYQSMNRRLSKEVLNKVDFLAVREPISLKYLESLNISAFIIPDFAFKASIFNKKSENIKIDNKSCLYTSGVLAVYPNQKGGVSIEQIKTHIKKIREIGYKPYFLMIEPKEEFIAEELKKMNVEIICSYEDGISFKNIGTIIKSFDLLVSGRYHIGIFGIMSHTKTFFLPSNTKKVQGLLQLIGAKELFIDADFRNFDRKVKNLDFNKYQNLDFEYYSSFKRFLKNVKID
ncbi:polysaccharide pyruvyl transferase family protein [Mariniflexile jejuense]|uniref:Polysaccharide pyruvyl transferase family protein n=1 Tax=Mariniflexile jejuense TaxID=1173582 RepID=A0ABW3JGJ3_9FLAO